MNFVNNNEYKFPPLSENETKFLFEWNENELTFKNFINIFRVKFFELTNPEDDSQISFLDRIEKFNFTKFNDNVLENPLAEMILFNVSYGEFKKQNNNTEAKRMAKSMYKCYIRFIKYLGVFDKDRDETP